MSAEIKEIRERAAKEVETLTALAPTGQPWDHRPMVPYWKVPDVLLLLAEIDLLQRALDAAVSVSNDAEEAIRKVLDPDPQGGTVE